MFELLTRRHPFLDTTAERLIRKVLYDEVTFTLRERLRIPRILRKLCLACLQKNPRKRPTGAQIHEALRGKGHAIEPFDAERFDLVGTMNRATTFSELGNRQEAKRLLLECLIHDPWSLSVRLNLAEVLFEEGDVSKAIETAEEALSLAKWSPDTGRSNVTLLLNLSYYNLIVDPRKSLEYGRAALEAAPADWHVLGNVAEACRLCVKALEPNNTTLLDEGFSACKKALTLNPKDEILRVTFAGLLFLSDRKAEFFRYLQELMQEIGDHNAPVRVLYVEALIRNGQLETARKLINEMRSTKVFQQIVPTLDRCLAEKVGHQSAGT